MTPQEKPEWLEDIQNKSWEPELFVSGGAIFFLLQVTEFLHRYSFIIMEKSGYPEPVIIANLVIAAFNALIFGFALHLVIRGFWVASVTLSYVFPKGVQVENIHYQNIYKKKLQKVRQTVDWVILLETISSLIFTLSFFFFLIIIGALITMLIILPHSSLKETWGENTFFYINIGSYILIFLGFVYMIDFLTLGYIKKQKSIARIYYPIYLVFSTLTLAPLYRTTYYTLVSNIKPWIAVITAVIYIAVAFGITYVKTGRLNPLLAPNKYLRIATDINTFYPRYYDNLRTDGDLIEHLCIQSDVIEGSFLRLFIVHQRAVENFMSSDCANQARTSQQMLRCYGKFYTVFIDDTLQKNIHWRSFTHPKSKEEGIIAFIPVHILKPTEHILKIVLNVASIKEIEHLKVFGLKGATYAKIPFWTQ